MRATGGRSALEDPELGPPTDWPPHPNRRLHSSPCPKHHSAGQGTGHVAILDSDRHPSMPISDNGRHAWARARTTWHHRSKAPPRSLDDRFPGGWTISRAQAPLRQGSHRRASGLYAFCTHMQPGHLRHSGSAMASAVRAPLRQSSRAASLGMTQSQLTRRWGPTRPRAPQRQGPGLVRGL